ncbi:hypothetical protein BCT30_02725 [Enterovibrio norvegicus]|uniref:hypothetical protein n=1 Tax=Enterovibrio norvegicus TaxID=188144 RepID=UPI000C83263E|nr:hypothetical protein [Enterovibrio norvegicus]PMI32239.1 hypothetical protein BCU47_12670 [Enterovibrio norvegicus]PMI33138.1 hypothetical protein BCU46_03410 [Enterovibrio norvegicus]PMN48312.1 hypothetical protein BCT30_02725 [Enterovibrio norvegicus]
MNKTIVKPVSDALVQRINTPLIGAFVLSWVLINHAFVVEFLFTSLESKVAMAKGSVFEWKSDLVYPAALTLLYLTIIPACQLLLDWGVLKTLGEFRQSYDVKIARNAVVSTQDYQIKLHDRELEDWVQDRQDLKGEIEELNQSVADLLGQLQASKDKNKELESSNEKLEEAINNAIESLQRRAKYAGSGYDDERSEAELIKETLGPLEFAVMDFDEIPF